METVAAGMAWTGRVPALALGSGSSLMVGKAQALGHDLTAGGPAGAAVTLTAQIPTTLLHNLTAENGAELPVPTQLWDVMLPSSGASDRALQHKGLTTVVELLKMRWDSVLGGLWPCAM